MYSSACIYVFIFRLREIAKREKEELEKALQISLEGEKKQTAEAGKLLDEVKQSAAKTSPQPTPVDKKPAPKSSPAASKTAPKPSPTESKTVPKPSPVKAKSPTQPVEKTPGLPPLSGQTKKEANKPSAAAAGWLKSAKEDVASGGPVTTAPVNLSICCHAFSMKPFYRRHAFLIFFLFQTKRKSHPLDYSCRI